MVKYRDGIDGVPVAQIVNPTNHKTIIQNQFINRQKTRDSNNLHANSRNSDRKREQSDIQQVIYLDFYH